MTNEDLPECSNCRNRGKYQVDRLDPQTGEVLGTIPMCGVHRPTRLIYNNRIQLRISRNAKRAAVSGVRGRLVAEFQARGVDLEDAAPYAFVESVNLTVEDARKIIQFLEENA